MSRKGGPARSGGPPFLVQHRRDRGFRASAGRGGRSLGADRQGGTVEGNGPGVTALISPVEARQSDATHALRAPTVLMARWQRGYPHRLWGRRCGCRSREPGESGRARSGAGRATRAGAGGQAPGQLVVGGVDEPAAVLDVLADEHDRRPNDVRRAPPDGQQRVVAAKLVVVWSTRRVRSYSTKTWKSPLATVMSSKASGCTGRKSSSSMALLYQPVSRRIAAERLKYSSSRLFLGGW